MEKDFSWNGEQYSTANGLQASVGERLIGLTDFSPYMSVLDAGCGSGNLSIVLAQKVPLGHVLAIDLSESMIRKASESSEAQALHNLEFKVCGINEIAFENMFDLVFSNSVLHWVTEIEDGIQRFCKALNPDGLLSVQFPLLDSKHPLLQYSRRAMQELGFSECFRGAASFPWYVPESTEQFSGILEKAGFHDIDIFLDSGVFAFPSATAVYQHFNSVGLNLFTAAMDEADKTAFHAQVLGDLTADFPNKAELLYERIFARAVKR
ncbi:MAG: methyltransferase domain-containing protein [Candidatus Limivicinus sp.]